MLLKPRYKYTKHPVQQPSCCLQGCFGSNGVDPQLEFTSVTSIDLPHWAPTEALWPHKLHQFGCRLFWNDRIKCIKWSETHHKELRQQQLAAGLVHCTTAILMKQIQVKLSRKRWGTLAKASSSWLPAAAQPLCSHRAAHLCSLPTLLWYS